MQKLLKDYSMIDSRLKRLGCLMSYEELEKLTGPNALRAIRRDTEKLEIEGCFDGEVVFEEVVREFVPRS